MSEYINNREIRIKKLKEIFLKLNQNESDETAKKELKNLFETLPHEEVIIAEQQLIVEGVKVEEIIKHCDLHSQTLREAGLKSELQVEEEHPIYAFIMENFEAKKLLKKIIAYLELLENGYDNKNLIAKIIESLKYDINLLSDIDKHYSRKENLIFPYLEKNNITGPSKVMWGKDDEIRNQLKKIREQLFNVNIEESQNLKELISNIRFAANLIEEMIYKEENILLPMAKNLLTESDWIDIDKQSDEIGFFIYYPEKRLKNSNQQNEENISNDGKISLPSGNFTLEELKTIFNSLPFDLTFVDKEDRVRFFTEGFERIFQRSRAIIGRKVQLCHPPSSVHVVEKILRDFKSGAQNKAEFWINFHGKFVYICYYAIRNEKGEYLGTLEVTQDITRIKTLEGERRILQYESN